MNEIINNIVTRRSCKSFRSDMLPYETIDKIVEAGLYAASGMGKQSPIILVWSRIKEYGINYPN